MLNYEVAASLLLPFVPAGTELDRWQDKVFVSLIGFRFVKTKLFGFLPIPMHSNFEEVNLRFYVRRHAGNEVRRGVVFIRELVPRLAIAFMARALYNEKYLAVPMAHDFHSGSDGLDVAYRWRTNDSSGEIKLQTQGDPYVPSEGSLEQFITQQYWGYTSQRDGGTIEYRVTHPVWELWQAREVSLGCTNTEYLYGKELATVLRSQPHSALFAEGSEVAVMRGRKL
jgi:hypothetical protein